MSYGSFATVVTDEDGKAVERLVNILNPDHIAWEKYARAHNIDATSSPMLAVTYRTFAALRRAGEISTSFDKFEQSVLEITPCNSNGVALEFVDGKLIDPENLGDDQADPSR
ncbi:hypothetical protein QP568_02915 [Propionimicrobium lymphophilum]|uniref:hypothetical protein n=1 Tax=Propionimicrobium lymphophilum TaxID=33012 RepID=UPI00254A49FA|nr:hypothetical protein [Propionimicrobium lymphophilum]MDK7709260.1 hypothetical protein [Propionimicrobium lymphophilum]MDK7733248.1 hypothetical protein [Propionimicrobium lymphophilum]